ncbi:uracil phosphoribosyltransferase [Luteibaculum oceani]|uniref:Uracil phosphoribosyltransferase n=1 Tax=Luteibaculum oceani TaxID=1294296 RepID=A0A5C6VA96_9FLAO|nr:uracil phosphoribosyltransferase [Luteibaculum oceani]TXC81740.1 uracil phosphoribosyltransferase [Luteibaculum oceani]
MVEILGEKHSILNQYLYELRSSTIQKDRLRFRENLKRVGSLMAYEISKTTDYKKVEVETPLGITEVQVPENWPIITTILRAGLPLHEGLLSVFDKADSGFISAYRNPSKNDDGFEVEVEYLSCPDLEGKELILCDTMLATGTSITKVYRALRELGTPSKIHVVAVIASKEGLEFAQEHFPAKTNFWLGAVDEEMTANSFIVPGLGDAGDLAFGYKD